MAYFFFDDGAPDAEDYVNNYVYFDEKNSESYRRVMETIKKYVPCGAASIETLRHELSECAC